VSFEIAKYYGRILLHSGRWGPGVVVFVLIALIPLGNPAESSDIASGLFFAFVVLGTILGRQIGSVDGSDHLDMVAALADGHRRLHRIRSATSWCLGALVALPTSAFAIVSSTTGPIATFGLAIVLSLTGLSVGATGATVLHPPVLRNNSLAVLLSIGYIIVLIVLPQVQDYLRTLENQVTQKPLLVLIACIGVWVLMTEFASRVASRSGFVS